MRYIVEQGQTTESRQKMVLSGFSAASRLTMLISVPMAMTLPGGGFVNEFLDVFGGSVGVGGLDDFHSAFGVDDDVDVGVILAGLGDLPRGKAGVD